MINFSEIDHVPFMKEALKEAEKAGKRGDRPIGAVIVHNGKIISRGSSGNKTQKSDIAHAETTAIYGCASYLQEYGRECIIYTTVEPCVMCLATAVLANIRNFVFAVQDKYMNTKTIIDSNPYIKARIHNYVSGILESESIRILKKYTPEDVQILQKGIRQ
ncbi:MAG TPA: nucleoside deaminase [Dehalococcoidales bacterium]